LAPGEQKYAGISHVAASEDEKNTQHFDASFPGEGKFTQHFGAVLCFSE